jgi:hypothetical protein
LLRQPLLPPERLALVQDQALNLLEHKNDDPTRMGRRELAVSGGGDGVVCGASPLPTHRMLHNTPLPRHPARSVCAWCVATQKLMYGPNSIYARQPDVKGTLSVTTDDLAR